MKHNNLRNRKAFTLVEMLVVLGIIGILTALSFSGITSALRTARRAQCLANMRQISTAILSYAGDNDADFPLTENPAWDIPLNPYLGVQTTSAPNPVLKCPQDSRPLNASGNFARSYSLNSSLPSKVIQITAPAQTILVAEWYSGGTTGPGGAGSNFQYGGRFDIVTYGAGSIPSSTSSVGYHGSTSNFAFVDGHAESLDPNVTIPLMWETVR
jgi:prepilin-type N-terminal cleavage/methylation domain-containing protein/prepilin-type processing-associated H-X9-DG protein